MSGATRGAVVLVMAALFMAGFSWKLQMDANARLEAEVDLIEKRFEKMQEQHEMAIDAGNRAARARDEIQELMNRRGYELENILGACPDLSLLELDPGLRDFLRNSCRNDSASSLLPDGSDSASRQIRTGDGG